MAVMTKRRFFHRRKVCRFCADGKLKINYKEPNTLKYFITERGKSYHGGYREPVQNTSATLPLKSSVREKSHFCRM